MREADFQRDFDFFTNKIKDGEPFAFARYADGEVRLMRGIPVGPDTQASRVDGWSHSGGYSSLGRELIEAMRHTEDNYYYAISAPTDNVNDFEFLNEKIMNGNRTFVNLWINSNYQRMMEFYRNLDREAWVICNSRADATRFPFHAKVIPFPDNCVPFWETEANEYMKPLYENFSDTEGELVLVSAGPASEAIIHRLYQRNPKNQYVDVGSSIDEFVHGRKTRPYMNPNDRYAREVSRF